MDKLRQDLRYTLRILRRSPGFTATVLLTLGIGIGANTAIFSFADALILRPVPYPDPDRVVMLWQDYGATGGPRKEWYTPPDYQDARQIRSFSAIAMMTGWLPSLAESGDPEVVQGGTVGVDYFAVAGIHALHGRVFSAEDETGDGKVVVLSHGLWQRRFGGDATVVGRTIQLNGEPWTVIGVMPRGFVPPFQAGDLWRPMTTNTFGQGCGRSCYVMRVAARVRPEASLIAAQQEMQGLAASLRERFPDEKKGVELTVVPLQSELASSVRQPLFVLLGAVGMLLLIACANIANLLLARAGAREREVAVRLALGAKRGVIFRQLLTENIGLAFIGAIVGALLALWGVNLLRGMSPPGTPRLDEVVVNGRALLFATVLALTTGLLFGLIPALQSSSTNLTKSLKEGSALRASGAKHRTRSALVVVETAIALTLLMGAGLLMRSFIRLHAVDPGFRAENTLSVDVLPPAIRYPESTHLITFYQDLFDRLSTRQGVIAAGGTSIAPLSGRNTDVSFMIEGRPLPRDREESPVAWYRSVTPGFFQAIGMRMLSGRGITADDRAGAPLVAVINETMAKRYWPGEDPIGQRISSDSPEGPWVTIVGVVADVHHNGPNVAPLVEMYLSYPQFPARLMTLMLRATGDPLELLPSVRAVVAQIDPGLPLARVTTMDEQLSIAMALPRLFVSFFGFFALVALSLAALGIYGITSFAVDQRKQEIGVRMALGAQAADVIRLILRQAATLAALGLTLGLACTLALARWLEALLFDMSPTDPLTYSVITLTLGLVAIIAGVLPARRATRLDPIKALRTD